MRCVRRPGAHPSLVKRFFSQEAASLREEQDEVFEQVHAHPAVPAAAATIVVSVDALSVLLRRESWKQAAIATITLLDVDGEVLRDARGVVQCTRLGEMPEEHKVTLMRRVAREVAALRAQRPDLPVEVVVDGAPDLREKLLAMFPTALHIIDFFHVAEHLADALRHLFPDDGATRAALRASWCHRLKHKQGTAFRLWRWLRDQAAREESPVPSHARREIEKHAEYIYRNRAFMDYPRAAAEGAALGSGIVEAACKTLVTQRLKVSGASWTRPGAAGVLYVRSLIQSGRFEDALRFHDGHRYAA